MNRFCHSCTAPLDMPDFKGPAENYCKYCTDDQGRLKPREVVRQGVAEWFKGWQPNLDDTTALARADHFMRAMPAWADQ
ncbi:MAG: hypothetical protein JW763_03480 [candidate division Zixibacteria bacterium]|nr:hypothetical protein [candidate division Zixibacteria bacterium]